MKKKLSSPFVKAITTLTSGTVIAQIITFLVSPIMTRMYSAEEMGVYTLILTTISIFGAIVCGRYDMAIVTVTEGKPLYAVIKLSYYTCLISSIIISIGYGIYETNFTKESIENTIMFTFIRFLLLFFTGIGLILAAYNNRKKEYKLMTSVNIVRSMSKNLLIVLIGIFKPGAIGLLISETVGKILGIRRQSNSLKPFFQNIKEVNFLELKESAKKNYRQPVFSVPAIFANNFSYSSINIFIKMLFGVSTLGYYSLSYRILGVPLSLITNNVSKVFFEEAANEYKKTNQFRRTLIKTSLFLIAIAIPMVIGLYFFSPMLFKFLYGSEWQIAGEYVKILAPMFGIRLLVSTLTPALIIVNKQGYELLIQILFVIVSVGTFIFIKFNHHSIETYLMLINIGFSLVYLFYFFYIFKISKRIE